MKCFFGIDGGATHTVGIVADDEGLVRARAVSGPANIHDVGIGGCRKALAKIVDVLKTAVGSDEFGSAWAGLAGVTGHHEKEIIRHLCREVGISGSCTISDDLKTAMAANRTCPACILIVSGTGSCVFGENPFGESLKAGGGGYLLGDEGSGFAIASHALRLARHAYHRRRPLPKHLAHRNRLSPRTVTESTCNARHKACYG